MTVAEAADVLGVSTQTIYNYIYAREAMLIEVGDMVTHPLEPAEPEPN